MKAVHLSRNMGVKLLDNVGIASASPDVDCTRSSKALFSRLASESTGFQYLAGNLPASSVVILRGENENDNDVAFVTDWFDEWEVRKHIWLVGRLGYRRQDTYHQNASFQGKWRLNSPRPIIMRGFITVAEIQTVYHCKAGLTLPSVSNSNLPRNCHE